MTRIYPIVVRDKPQPVKIEACKVQERNGIMIIQLFPIQEHMDHFYAIPEWCHCLPSLEYHFDDDGAVTVMIWEHHWRQ